MKRDANGVLERGFDCTVPSMASPYSEYSLNCLRETRDLAPNCEAIVMDDMIIRDQRISHDTYFSQAFEKQVWQAVGEWQRGRAVAITG